MTAAPSPSAHRQPAVAIERRLDSDEAFRHAVGADFLTTGAQELALLRALGLDEGHVVVDVGCGAGRLGYQLAPFPGIRYFGCDPSPEVLRLTGELTHAPHVQFAPSDGATLPGGAPADFVCFFSVFEHLHYEDIFKYLLAAAARLKPGGLLVLTFFEFRVASHWASFLAGVESPSDHLNQFIDRDALAAWAAHAGFAVQRVTPGDAGRSMAILQKRRKHETAADFLRTAVPGSPAALPLRIANTSNRVFVGEGEQSFVQGLVLRGAGTRHFLLRAVGPSLKKFNVTQPVLAPLLAVHDVHGGEVASGRGWDPTLAPVFTATGAFALPAGSGDAAFIVTLSEGNYTLSVSSEKPGIVLVEVYELAG